MDPEGHMISVRDEEAGTETGDRHPSAPLS